VNTPHVAYLIIYSFNHFNSFIHSFNHLFIHSIIHSFIHLWLQVVATAHSVGLRTTSTIMFGHVDSPHDWASHLLQLRDLQVKNCLKVRDVTYNASVRLQLVFGRVCQWQWGLLAQSCLYS
jgi:hypothetical protein